MEHTVTYVCEKNGSLAAIAKDMNVSEEELRKLNPYASDGQILKGTALTLPACGGCPKGSFYKMRAGDTLPKVAALFGISLSRLLKANPYLDARECIPGQMIIIPSGVKIYTVKVGARQRLSDVLRIYDMSVKELRELNPGLDVFSLKTGDRIRVLDGRRVTRGYLISEGESLSSVAGKFGVSTAELLRANQDLRPQEFCAGVRISIPKSESLGQKRS